jgi:hypothetical protein
MSPKADQPNFRDNPLVVYMFTNQVRHGEQILDFPSLDEAWDYAEQYQSEHSIRTRDIGRWYNKPKPPPSKFPKKIWGTSQ